MALFILAQCLACLVQYDSARAFTVQDEREYGKKMLTTIRSEFPLIHELDVTQYLNDLGQDILNVAGSQYFNYHFYVIKNDELNAFAAPSGLIFVHSGLISKTENEGELLSVVAHEIGHVKSRHIAGRSEQAPKLTAATLALILAGMAVGAGPLSEALVMGGMAAGQAMSLKYSREDEEEADREALEFMREMNRDPKNMLSMLNKMHRLYKIRMGNIPQYLLTHPIPRARMNYVEDLINLSSSSNYEESDDFAFNRIQTRINILTGDLEKLKNEYQRLLKVDSAETTEQAFALYGLALVLHEQGRFHEAAGHMKEIMERYKDKSILWTDLGRIYLDAGKNEKALGLFEKNRQTEPANMYNNYYLALALERTGNLIRAEKIYHQIRGHIEDYPPVYKHIARINDQHEKQGYSHYYLGLYYYYNGEFSNSQLHLRKARTELDNEDSKQKNIEDILSRIEEYRS